MIFGGGSTNTSDSESLEGVEFVTAHARQPGAGGTGQTSGNVGGQPHWSWYGFNSRVEWCACFVSWCYGQMGLSEPRFAGCQSQVPRFQSHGNGARGAMTTLPRRCHLRLGPDGAPNYRHRHRHRRQPLIHLPRKARRHYHQIRSYDVNYEMHQGYGLMNW